MNSLKLGQIDGETKELGFQELFSKLQTAIEVIGERGNNDGGITIMIDDISMLEIAAHGCLDQILDFLHYCITLTSEYVRKDFMLFFTNSYRSFVLHFFVCVILLGLCSGDSKPWRYIFQR